MVRIRQEAQNELSLKGGNAREDSEKEKEIYDLKHDLIADQIKLENYEEKIKALEADKQELLVQKSKLEASLEDALLGDIAEDK